MFHNNLNHSWNNISKVETCQSFVFVFVPPSSGCDWPLYEKWHWRAHRLYEKFISLEDIIYNIQARTLTASATESGLTAEPDLRIRRMWADGNYLVFSWLLTERPNFSSWTVCSLSTVNGCFISLLWSWAGRHQTAGRHQAQRTCRALTWR